MKGSSPVTILGCAHARTGDSRESPRIEGEQATPAQQETLMASDNIFSGLKVVEMASFIAGPSAAVILSDFGADVIKVEPPSGDTWRAGHKIPPQPPDS